MKSYKLAVFYGFLLWLIPSILMYLISTFLQNYSKLQPLEYVVACENLLLLAKFKYLISTICVVLLSGLYFSKLEANFLKEGVILGIIWFVIGAGMTLLPGLVIILQARIGLAFTSMLQQVPVYLIYPTITVGFGYLLKAREEIKASPQLSNEV